ncbi:DUF2490 domain-containing protein [Candidatus Neomarinimicrobiota bacterium]
MPHFGLRWPLLLAFLGLVWPGSILLAADDNQLWTALVLQKKLPGNFDLEFNQEIRSRDNFSTFKKSITEIGLFYSFNEHLNTSVDYRYIAYRDKTGKRVGLTGRYKLTTGKFSHQYRAKLQQELIEGDATENSLRHKYTVRYRRNGGFSPYLALELFYQLGESTTEMYKYRSTTGVRKKLSKSSTAKLYYRLQQEVNKSNPDRVNIFGFEYEISLKSSKRSQDSPKTQP